jgi:PleD family two-component response regulator
MLVIGVNGLRNLSEAHDRQIGDCVLRVVGATVKGLLRPHDTVARFGDDEFAAALPRNRRLGSARSR